MARIVPRISLIHAWLIRVSLTSATYTGAAIGKAVSAMQVVSKAVSCRPQGGCVTRRLSALTVNGAACFWLLDRLAGW
jgi:hypothetical protein